MKPFDQWVMEPVTPANQKPALPDGLWEDKKGNILARCRRCECPYSVDWLESFDDFDQDMSYCGKSDRCIP